MIMQSLVGLGVIGMELMKNILYVKKELKTEDEMQVSLYNVQFVVYVTYNYSNISVF